MKGKKATRAHRARTRRKKGAYMITLGSKPAPWQGGYKFEFEGLSTDTKPEKEYDGKAIANGSTYLSIDTQSVNFYDAENGKWV